MPKRAHDDAIFTISFDQATALRQLVDVVQPVLTRACFTVKPSGKDGVLTLCVDTIDPSHMCMVQAKLECYGTLKSASHQFTIDSKMVQTCLKNVSSHHAVELSAREGSADLFLVSFDMLTKQKDLAFELPTYEETAERLEIETIEYDATTEVDLGSFKRILKLGADLEAENMTLVVYEAPAKEGVKGFRIDAAGKGTASFRRSLMGAKSELDGSAATVDVSDATGMAEVCSSSFKIGFLGKFVKAMEQSTIEMRLGKNGAPMLLHYALGVPGSFVRFVVASNCEFPDDE